jgi:hypothetical protein
MLPDRKTGVPPMYAWQTLRPSTLVRALRQLRRLLRV